MEGFKFQPLRQEERKWLAVQSQQLGSMTGEIEWLHTILAKAGDATTFEWLNAIRYDLRDKDGYTQDRDAVAKMAFTGPLLNKATFKDFASSQPEMKLDTGCVAFKVATTNFEFLFEITEDLEAFCFAYKKQWLDLQIERARQGIRFVDLSSPKDLFRLADGDKLWIDLPDGDRLTRTVRFIDSSHFEIGNDIYHIDEWAERVKRSNLSMIPLRENLPPRCFVYLPTMPNKVGVVQKGESGYYTTVYEAPSDEAEARTFVAELNAKMGVTPAQASAMEAGSMFGWTVPAADPASYDGDGLLKGARREGA